MYFLPFLLFIVLCIWNFHLLLRWELCWQNVKLNCIWSWRMMIWCQDELICNLLSSLAFTPAAHVFVRRWSLAECHFNASRGASRMGVFNGHSAGVSGVLRSVVRVSVSRAWSLQQLRKQLYADMHPHTWTHTQKRLEDLPESLFKLTQVSWYPRATPLQPPAPPPFFFSNRLCWKEPIVRWLVTRHPIYQ